MPQFTAQFKLEIRYSMVMPPAWRANCKKWWLNHINDSWLRRVMSIINDDPNELIQRQRPVSLGIDGASIGFRDDMEETIIQPVRAIISIDDREPAEEAEYIRDKFGSAIKAGLDGWLELMGASSTCQPEIIMVTAGEWLPLDDEQVAESETA